MLTCSSTSYLAWPALALSINSMINQHPLRTKDGGTSPITSVLCVPPLSMRCRARTDVLLPMPQCRRVCAGHCLPSSRDGRASESNQPSAPTHLDLISVTPCMLCVLLAYLSCNHCLVNSWVLVRHVQVKPTWMIGIRAEQHTYVAYPPQLPRIANSSPV